jgi:hypothetical protein
MSISFSNGLAVTSSARKLIIRVPQGPVVSFPQTAINISEYGQNNDQPVIVVHNAVDLSMGPKGTWQGADGINGVIIMNGVPDAIAQEVLDMVEYCEKQPGGMNTGDLKTIVDRAVALGQGDIYTTKLDFVDKQLSPAGRTLGKYTGVVKRDSREICLVVRDTNGVIQRKLGDDVKHIDTDEILVRDYVLADGSKIDPKSIPNG